MLTIQISAGHGPKECMRAVYLAYQHFQYEARKQQLTCDTWELEPGEGSGTLRSVTLGVSEPTGGGTEKIDAWIATWEGTLQWICASPYRKGHERKNWFIGVQVFHVSPRMIDEAIRYEACRARGSGGQHVNTTNSAVIAIHDSTGLRVRSESERSQHMNKKRATALLRMKIAQHALHEVEQAKASQRLAHFQVARGNPKRIYRGESFDLQTVRS